MTLAWIVAGTAAGGVLSVLLAAVASLTVLARFADRLLAFAVGVLLAAALLELLPEAAEQLSARDAGAVALAVFVVLFALEKAAIWRHAHHHGTLDAHGHRAPMASVVVAGDAVHNFADGVVIAAAFLQDPALGVAATAAVITHEIPQEIGDFAVLLRAGCTRRQALALNALSGCAAIAGGLVGYFALQQAEHALPYALAAAAASFLYIAAADLVPLLQRHARPADLALQLALIAAGTAVVVLPGGH